MSSDKNLRILDTKKLVDSENLYRIAAISDNSMDREAMLNRNPSYAGMSYWAHTGKKYKDLSSYLKKFRCKHCNAYAKMSAISRKDRPEIIDALICTNCSTVSPLDVPIDKNNIGNSMAVQHRPTLIGKSTKFKSPLTESEKLGLRKPSLRNLPGGGSPKTFLLEDQYGSKSPENSMFKIVTKHLRRAGFPMPTTHSVMRKNIENDDADFSRMMEGKGVIKNTIDIKAEDIRRRFGSIY